MARTPCCEKMGMKKGPWTPEEDQILISYIQQYGHANWRALPKQAGLLRCGKSCRLRWINYLRPDIKRGKFSNEEEDTIIQLHQILGNRWAAIAARLPGRTDNEIKNFWHTHLKKRLQRVSEAGDGHPENASSSYLLQQPACSTSEALIIGGHGDASSSGTTGNNVFVGNQSSYSATAHPASGDHCAVTSTSISASAEAMGSHVFSEEMEFWYDLYMRTGKPSQAHQNP